MVSKAGWKRVLYGERILRTAHSAQSYNPLQDSRNLECGFQRLDYRQKRPILRGRDIKRYGYEWAELWLIATFPSRHYNIDEYPAVKQYLLSFGIERLEQTGKTHIVNGQKVKSRKKTHNKWFETQDSISYWEDFLKPKIIYPNMTKYMPFAYDNQGYLTNQKCFIMTGVHIPYLTAFLNSNIFKICYRDCFPELQGGTRELSKIFFENIRIPRIDKLIEYDIENMLEDAQLGNDYADLRIDKALIMCLSLQEYETFILNYQI